MSSSITVKYDVIDQVVSDINRLADQAETHAKAKKAFSRSKGASAKSAQESARLVAEYARTLAAVMRSTAQSINEAKLEMMAADESAAQQYVPDN